MFEAALGTALSVIFLITYVDLRKALGYAWLIDIVSFCTLTLMFMGTYAGMVTGMLATLIISVFLRLARRVLGYQVFRRYQGKWQWVTYDFRAKDTK